MELILYIISFLISAAPALFLTAPPVEDALGTLGAAAYLAGVDYGEFLVADGYYYKYGQALWYLPVYLCVKDPAIRYKVMLVVNSALDAFVPVIAYRISRRFLLLDKKDAVGVSVLAGLVPSMLLYCKYTWAEPALFLVIWVVAYLILELNADPGKSGLRCALLAWTCVYSFMAHQRGIVIVIAAALLLLIVRAVYGKWMVSRVIFLGNMVAALVMDRVCDYWLKQVVYRGVAPKHNTLATFLHPEIYRKIFSPDGQLVVGRTVLGWLCNYGVSGIGFALLGVVLSVVIVARIIRKGTHGELKGAGCNSLSLLGLWGMLLFSGAFALGIMFFFEGLYGYWDGTMVERCDHLVFGRYLESSLPLMLFLGLVCLLKENDKTVKKMVIGVGAAMAALIGFFAFGLAPAMEGVDSYVHSLMSMNYMFDMTGVTLTRDLITNLPMALMVAGGIAFVLYVLVCVLMINRNRMLAYCVMCAVFLFLYLHSFVDVILRIDYYGLTKYAVYYINSY